MGGSVDKPKVLMQIIHNLACQSDIKKAHGNKYDPLLEKNVRRQKHPRDVVLLNTIDIGCVVILKFLKILFESKPTGAHGLAHITLSRHQFHDP